MSPIKKLAFSLVPLLVLFGALEAGLWMAGRELDTSDPYVGFEAGIPLFVEVEENGVGMMRTASNKRRFFNDQAFPVEKRADARRIFCMGGSTTYGRPYRDVTSFCAWVRASLETLAPETDWEVINAGGISYASYRVAALMEELAAFEPDLFIVYTGHNEFLEERTYGSLRDRPAWLQRTEFVLRHTRSWGAMKSMVDRFAGRKAEASRSGSGKDELAAEVETRLESSVGLDAYHRDDGLTEAILRHFRFNLDRMATIARNAGAGILYVVPADNLRDCSPFKSEFSRLASADEIAAFEKLLQEANDALYRNEIDAARRLFERAVGLDPRHAHARYGLGRALAASGDTEAARREFVAARDEDVCPLRALSAIPEIVREVAASRGLPSIDFPRLLAQASGRGTVPGADWFLDHVHPTIAGHRLLARHIVHSLHRLGWISADPESFRAELDEMERERLARLDPLEHGLALRNLAKVLSWAGKSEDAARAARQALEMLGDDEDSFFVLAEYAASRHDPEAAIGFLREALRMDPDWVKARNNLGVQLMQLGRTEEALAEYEAALRIDPHHAASRFNRANALKRLHRFEESIAAYEACLEADPQDVDSLYNLAGAFEAIDRPDRALHILDRLLEIDPDDPEAREWAETLRTRASSTNPRSGRESA